MLSRPGSAPFTSPEYKSTGGRSVIVGQVSGQTDNWREWSRRYRDEMLGGTTAEPQNSVIRKAGQKFTLRLIKHLAERQKVTLLCHCRPDAVECHRFLLQDLLQTGNLILRPPPKSKAMILFQKQPDADTQFRNWCSQNADGFDLNRKSDGKFMLHKAACAHAGVLSPGNSPTTNPKCCSLDRVQLESWAREQGAEVAFCSDCL